MKTYLLMDAETREPVGEHEVGDDNTLQVGAHIVLEAPGEDSSTWEVLGTVDEDERPVALVRPAAGA
jgi:hypothetical protein